MMEVDSLPGDDGPPALSPNTASVSTNKIVDEDDSLGYTITMNDCDEEESNDNSSAPHSRAATPSAEQNLNDSNGQAPKVKAVKVTPVQNGDKISRDISDPKSKKKNGSVNKADCNKITESPKMNGVSQSSDDEEQGENVSKGEKEEKGKEKTGGDTDVKTPGSKNADPPKLEREQNNDGCEMGEGVKEKDDTIEQEAKKKKTENIEQEKNAGDEKPDHDKKARGHDAGDGSADGTKEKNKEPSGSSASCVSVKTGKLTSDSTGKTLGTKLAPVPNIKPKGNSVVLEARPGVSLPYTSSAATSLLSSSAGVRLLLPSSGSSQVMYIPSSGGFLNPSATSFQPASSVVSTTAPFLIPAINAPVASSGQSLLVSGQRCMTAGTLRPPVGLPQATLTFESSSIGMINMIKWETENHLSIKPKYAKPNPKAELGNLAKWIFDLGADLVKETVYHDLVKVQKKRKDDGSLSDKEKSDFKKLQEIDEDLNKKIGHLKFRLSKSCKCGFRADLNSVLYLHKEYAHHERGGFLNCSMCKFSTRQPGAFKFHMESIHSMTGRADNRPCFFECALCPYESNYQNRLDQHKIRCLKQYRPQFNMHPSCLTGPEVNLCLENVFYYVFTRQFMNTINPPSSSAASSSVTVTVASSTSMRNVQPKTVASLVGKLNARTSTTTSASNALQYASKSMVQIGTGPGANQLAAARNQLAGYDSKMSRNYPVISSQIGGKQSSTSFPAGATQSSTGPSQQTSAASNSFEVCEICGGYVKDRKALRIHFFYAHRIDMPFGVFERTQPPLYCATCFARFWTAQGLQKHIEVHKADLASASAVGNGVAGKCISCGHRVPNILMHMRMVHNRELRHYLAALMCIFCGNRFSSKPEVENHMGQQHGVVVKNSAAQASSASSGHTQMPALAARTVSQHTAPSKPAVKPPAQAAPAPPKAGGSKLNRGSQCVLCNLTFTRNVDLTRHCMRVHHTCMKCGLVVVDKESLNRHTCLHSAAGMRTCQICGEQGFHPAYYIKHMRDHHLKRCSVQLRRVDRATVDTLKRPITISDSEDDDIVIQTQHKSTAPKQQKLEEPQENSSSPKPPTERKEHESEKNSMKQPLQSTGDRKGQNSDRDNGPKSDDGKEKKADGGEDDKKKSDPECVQNSGNRNSEEEKKLEKEEQQCRNIKEQKSYTEAEKKPAREDLKAGIKKDQTSVAEEENNSAKEGKKKDQKSDKEDAESEQEDKTNRSKKGKKPDDENSDISDRPVENKDGCDESDSEDKRRRDSAESDTGRTEDDKKMTEKKRKSVSSSDEDADDVPYSKKLRRSSRTNNDSVELD